MLAPSVGLLVESLRKESLVQRLLIMTSVTAHRLTTVRCVPVTIDPVSTGWSNIAHM